MEISDKRIDGGKAFDWGRASNDYAKFRDIYPERFYDTLYSLGVGKAGQRVLDIGSGTGVLPRNMAHFGAVWTGCDISDDQIKQAISLTKAQGLDIDYRVCPADKLPFDNESFDAVTACQCYWYFDHKRTAAEFSRVLKAGGRLLICMMNWLPFEDEIAGKTEQLVLKYNPAWSGANDTFKSLILPQEYTEYFTEKENVSYRLPVHFTRESWNGRIKACRAIGASDLTDEQRSQWESEHLAMLSQYPVEFDVAHYACFTLLEKK